MEKIKEWKVVWKFAGTFLAVFALVGATMLLTNPADAFVL